MPNERVYLILKATVRLSHPAAMELILRKRLSINVYKKQSFTNMIKRRIVRSENPLACGVTYEVVSNIPKVKQLFMFVDDLQSLRVFHGSTEHHFLTKYFLKSSYWLLCFYCMY